MIDVRYARSGDVDIAYHVVGDGPVPLVWTEGAYTHLDLEWEIPEIRTFASALTDICTVLRYDKRGMGMSSRVPGSVPLEVRMDDIRAVLDAEGIEQAALYGEAQGAALSMLFTAAYPERVSHLILQTPIVRERPDTDWPWGRSDEEFAQQLAKEGEGWGRSSPGSARSVFGPAADAPRVDEALAKVQAYALTPRDWLDWLKMAREIDARGLAGSVRVPTLVLHARECTFVDIAQSRHLVDLMPDARLVELDGWAVNPVFDPEQTLAAVRELLTGTTAAASDRRLVTVLFTDIVGSTRLAAEMGDARWRSVLEIHHEQVRNRIGQHRGVEVASAGDGFLARFDGPVRALQAAEAIIDDASGLGLDVRAGAHTGEVEVMGDDIAGIAVHIGARIGGLAGGGEILVSGAVRDISAGSDLVFRDRGEHELKGVPGSWRVYSVDR